MYREAGLLLPSCLPFENWKLKIENRNKIKYFFQGGSPTQRWKMCPRSFSIAILNYCCLKRIICMNNVSDDYDIIWVMRSMELPWLNGKITNFVYDKGMGWDLGGLELNERAEVHVTLWHTEKRARRGVGGGFHFPLDDDDNKI